MAQDRSSNPQLSPELKTSWTTGHSQPSMAERPTDRASGTHWPHCSSKSLGGLPGWEQQAGENLALLRTMKQGKGTGRQDKVQLPCHGHSMAWCWRGSALIRLTPSLAHWCTSAFMGTTTVGRPWAKRIMKLTQGHGPPWLQASLGGENSPLARHTGSRIFSHAPSIIVVARVLQRNWTDRRCRNKTVRLVNWKCAGQAGSLEIQGRLKHCSLEPWVQRLTTQAEFLPCSLEAEFILPCRTEVFAMQASSWLDEPHAHDGKQSALL